MWAAAAISGGYAGGGVAPPWGFGAAFLRSATFAAAALVSVTAFLAAGAARLRTSSTSSFAFSRFSGCRASSPARSASALRPRRELLELLQGEGHGRHFYPDGRRGLRAARRRRSRAGSRCGSGSPPTRRRPGGSWPRPATSRRTGRGRGGSTPTRSTSWSSTTSCARPGCAGRRTRSASAGPGRRSSTPAPEEQKERLPVRPAVGRGHLVPAVQRAGRGQRPRRPGHARRPRRRRVGRERPEDLDVAGPARPVRHPHRPHRPRRRPSSRASRTSSARWTRRASRSGRSSR